jgi:3-hydroxybutyryl-CoA dehydrogenase
VTFSIPVERAMSIEEIGIVGAGTMGNGIAQVSAMAGLDVVLVDVDEAILNKALATVQKSLDRIKKKDPSSELDANAVIGRIRPTTRLKDASGAGCVIEAAPEILELKLKLLPELDGILPKETILATNTSSISITKLAAATERPEQFIGMHFFNPVPVMQLVEVVRGLATSEDTFKTIMKLASKLGKTPIGTIDSPGFVANRILLPLLNEAFFAYSEGLADAEGIDTIMKLGMNHPIGPLALADLVGLDVCLDVLEVLYEEFRDSKYRPCPLLRRMVAAGYLGRKTGKGFHTY